MGMKWDRRAWMTLAAASAMISVIAGAFAAHWAREPAAKDLLMTGTSYQFMHALSCVACSAFMQAGARRARFAPAFFLSGTVLFSGSLYALALGAPRWMGAATPAGGALFLIGWVAVVWAARDIDPISAGSRR
jgi:uncharacterized membrane protein YgdD (TMEM256/DUF423 family)